jgi:peptide-methionine (R)-S-oxide reductase
MKRRKFLNRMFVLTTGATFALPVLNIFGSKLINTRVPARSFAAEQIKVFSVKDGTYSMNDKTVKSPDEWREILTSKQYYILREKGTERPFSGKYNNHYEDGVYQCAGCGLDLYSSRDKYNSGTGWPSFSAPVAPENISTKEDHSFLIRRTELLCARCDGHLGHVFDDGPEPTGLRHCINSVSLSFVGRK